MGDAAEKPVIEFLYPDAGPFLQSAAESGDARGPIAIRVEALATKAGYEIKWTGPIPRNRILADMQDGRAACTPNAIKTPDREARFKFTQPIFPALDQVVVTKKDAAWVDSYDSVDALMHDTTRVYGDLLGASQGPALDRTIAEETRHVRPIRGTPADLVKMVISGHVDYIILADGPSVALAASALGIDPAVLATHHFPDMRSSAGGHIMCAQSVGNDVIAAFDKAIADGR
ncbi:MAG: transporter substrate-binding domain-containing protein [Azospirillaceae bacterium]|nr:transporter substrate-binding domain-containing protein [Azospirillaceae bacterium]